MSDYKFSSNLPFVLKYNYISPSEVGNTVINFLELEVSIPSQNIVFKIFHERKVLMFFYLLFG